MLYNVMDSIDTAAAEIRKAVTILRDEKKVSTAAIFAALLDAAARHAYALFVPKDVFIQQVNEIFDRVISESDADDELRTAREEYARNAGFTNVKEAQDDRRRGHKKVVKDSFNLSKWFKSRKN